MAKQYPKSQFYGFDNHKAPIEAAKPKTRLEKLEQNLEFSVFSANEFIGNEFDLINFFDCLHDMGDPLGALTFAKNSLKENGTCMIVKPVANDKLEDNLNLEGRIYYSASTVICVSNSLADKGTALGAQAGENTMRELALKAGSSKFRRALQTPFNIIYEAKFRH